MRKIWREEVERANRFRGDKASPTRRMLILALASQRGCAPEKVAADADKQMKMNSELQAEFEEFEASAVAVKASG